MSKGGGGTNTVQQADPWSGVQPQLLNLFSNAQNYYNSGGPQYYPGQTVAAQSPNTLAALQAGSQYAMSPGANLTDITNDNTNIAQGKNLGNNPYLDQMVSAATNGLAQNYTNVVAPSIASQFSAAGRFGSGQQAAALATGAQPLAQALQGATSNIYGQAWNSGLAQQTAAIGEAPTLANQPYTNLNALMGIGQTQESYQQNLINAAMQKYNFGQNQPLTNLQAFQGLLNGGLQSGSQSSSQTQLPNNPFASLLGTALTGNSLYNSGALGALGGLFGSGTAGAGLTAADLAAAGALGGGAATGLGTGLGMLSYGLAA